MSKVFYSQYLYNCEVDDIDIYFEYNNSVVFSTRKSTKVFGKKEIKKCKEVVVITKCELEDFEGLVETFRYSRGENLVVQGIISFFSGYPLTVYQSNESSSKSVSMKYEKREVKLMIDNVDYTGDLKILLNKLKEEPELIITILDRWRKAIYLKDESVDADLYYDEAILSFFHIFELFGNSVNDELKDKLEDNIVNMLYQHFKFYYYTDKQIKEKVEGYKKPVNSLLIGDFLNLSVKVKYFLEKYDLLDDSTAFFIDEMVKVRNSVAHGRITYQQAFMWPLSPFFSLSKDPYDNIEILYFLTAEMISRYVGITCWEKEWKEKKECLMPPQHIISSFMKGDLLIENFDMLFSGNKYNITWKTIFIYYIKNHKKVKRESFEKVIKDGFMNLLLNENNAQDIFNVSIILADSEDSEIKKKAIENVNIIISNKWCTISDLKNIYTYLEYYSVNVIWYKQYLNNKDYLKYNKKDF